MADAPNRIPPLLVDFSKDVDWNIAYPVTDAAMAKALGGTEAGWTADGVRLALSRHPILSAIPMRCAGLRDEACPYSDYCPFEMPEVVEKNFTGHNCPVEVVEAFKAFAGFVVDLQIQPEDYSDLQLVMDLVRLLLLERRCDLYNKDKPIWEESLAGINQKSGAAYYEKKPVLTFEMMRSIRKDIKDIYDQLIASRAAKAKRDASMKTDFNPTKFFEAVKAANEAIARGKRGKKLEELPAAVDAEFEVGEPGGAELARDKEDDFGKGII